MKKPILLLIALGVFGLAAPGQAAAQDTTGGAAQGTTTTSTAAQGEDPKEATDAALAWKNLKDAASKTTAGVDLITKYPGTKAADFVAGTAYNDQSFSPEQKAAIARAYYETYTQQSREGQYLDYSLGLMATTEKDPAKSMEYAQLYLQKYPQGSFRQYVEPIIVGRRADMFKAAISSNNLAEAEKIANEAFASGQNEFYYAYTLADAALRDMTQKGAQSQYIDRSGAWIDRALAFVEGGKVPTTVKDPAEWNKSKPTILGTLYRARGIRNFMLTARKGTSATAADYTAAITDLQKAASTNDQDILAYYFIGQACNAQYGQHAQKFGALTAEQQAAPESKAMLDEVNNAADCVITNYVKVMQLAGDKAEMAALKNAVQPVVAELYKYRHPETPDGWKAMVSGGASAAAPAPAATTQTTTTAGGANSSPK